ncbi:hypothetical protein L2E82_32246 [Cichorium intybus]|uniref:Uncharacterized protein n=1 Tax=Cichorium intybus TaxID=13427 RepID=A0ACB9BJ05_CICIN|nr:hypothetical protein L2E82_32246 [Cichorium intybus]
MWIFVLLRAVFWCSSHFLKTLLPFHHTDATLIRRFCVSVDDFTYSGPVYICGAVDKQTVKPYDRESCTSFLIPLCI